jgi:hypothetical protein
VGVWNGAASSCWVAEEAPENPSNLPTPVSVPCISSHYSATTAHPRRPPRAATPPSSRRSHPSPDNGRQLARFFSEKAVIVLQTSPHFRRLRRWSSQRHARVS